MSDKPEALIWGAGKIGRGFLAEIFDTAGYHINFIDYVDSLVDQLKKASQYTVHKAIGKDTIQKIIIKDFDAYSSKDTDIIVNKAEKKDSILAVAVHPAALPDVVKVISNAIVKKAEADKNSTLNIILCINMLHPASYCRELFLKELPTDCVDYFNKNVGLIESVVMRMAPQATKEMLDEDPLAVLNNGYPEMPVDGKAFRGKVPNTPMLRLSNDINAEEVRKIYTLNLAHAMLAYLGTPKGYVYAAECVMDNSIREIVENALSESGKGLSKEYGFPEDDMKKWNEAVMKSLENSALKDKLDRLGADSKRKLGRNDRLVGPAMLCIKYCIEPENLAKGIAYGFKFNQPNDDGTVEVQQYLKANTIDSAIKKFCGLKDEDKLTNMIKAEYSKI